MASPSEMEIAPVYEIVLSREDEHADGGPVKVINAREEDKLTLKCVGGSGMKAESIKLQKKLDDGFKDVGVKAGSSVVYDIDSFAVVQHSGVYDCSAQRLDNGAEHSKMVRLQRKSKKPNPINNATFCHMNDDFCNGQGQCYIYDSIKFCDCFDDYTGKNCELVPMHIDAVNIVKYVASAGGALTIITIFLTILFGIFLYKEKGKTKTLTKIARHFIPPNKFHLVLIVDPDELLHDCDSSYTEKAKGEKDPMIQRDGRRAIRSYPSPIGDVEKPVQAWDETKKPPR